MGRKANRKHGIFLFFFFLLSPFVQADIPGKFPDGFSRTEEPAELRLKILLPGGEEMIAEELELFFADSIGKTPFFKRQTGEGKNKIIAAILACPFPFGMLGLHRIYLGTKPVVPVVYIATFGGCLGILPFIDFVVIILEKDITSYQENGKIFMWVR